MAPPTGGKKDITPPKLQKSNPPMQSVYFDEGGFQLEFDENVGLENVHSQLVVSPPMKERPDVKYNKKKITVHFDKDDLLENTTYNFNFGNSIKDHNEGNILKNFSYVFSTGSYIDSISISGHIHDAFTEDPLNNVIVLLYRNLEDSMPLTSLPNYFGMSDELGEYTIGNIKNGEYKLFALEDLNQNYIYDQASERIAFLDEFLLLDSNLSEINFNVFGEETSNQFVSERQIEDYGKLLYKFNKPLKDLNITLINAVFEKDEYVVKLSEEKDSLYIWFPDFKDTFTMILNDDSSFIDTTEMEIIPVFSMEEMPPFRIIPNFKGKIDFYKELDLNFDNPIYEWNPKMITLYEDSVEKKIEPYFVDSLKLTLRIPYKWDEEKKYLLLVGLGSFIDFYDQRNDILELKFGAQEENFYGKINLDIDLGETQPPFIFQLLDVDKNVIDEKTLTESQIVTYTFLRPKEYGFRLIQDLNNNGKWDTGEYESKRQPEPIIYFPGNSKVRSNWELDLTWGIELD